MLAGCLILGLTAGLPTPGLLKSIDAGFGSSLGEYALILLPSFALAAALASRGAMTNSGLAAVLMAPVAGAAMVCPDTAYAALSPMAGVRKLSTLFGAYAGFKLLVPAGPLIVAQALGGVDSRLVFATFPVFTVTWLTGQIFARQFESSGAVNTSPRKMTLVIVLAPMGVLFAMVGLGLAFRGRLNLPATLDFLLSPKGALLTAAIVALVPLSRDARAAALESAVKRTAPLLLTIGAASVLGAMIVQVFPISTLASGLAKAGMVLPALFCFTASFKVAKGSSMATFAGTSGIVAALLPSLHVSPEAATLSMCAGAFVTIAPNDSLYWLVRNDALSSCSDTRSFRILAVGGLLQGIAALAVVLVMAECRII